MLTSRKSEASLEFMIFVGILLIFFVFFVEIVGKNNKDIDDSTVFTKARNILNTVTNQINTASRIEGYYSEFQLPDKVTNGQSYNITVYTSIRMVKIEWNNGKNIMSNIITENVTGNVTSGFNSIKNVQGIVKINEG